MADNSHSRTTTVVPSDEADIVDTDFLIVGAGVAGSALASFLASYGTNNKITTLIFPY